MKKLQCELCNSVDIVKTADNLFLCQHCGCKYTTEQAKALFAGTVEVTFGNAELERRLKNAQTQLQFGDLNAASISYGQLQQEYAADYRVWLGTLKLRFAEYDKEKITPSNSRVKDLQDLLKKTFALNKDPAAQKEIQRTWMRFWENAAEKIRSGEYIFLGAPDPALYRQISPGMEKMVLNGMQNAAILNQAGITAVLDYYYDNPRFNWTTYNQKDGFQLCFVMGRTIIGRERGAWHVTSANPLWNYSCAESITPLNIPKLQAQAEQFAREQRKREECPHCGFSMQKTVFGAKCQHCASLK